jgi:hypothetical protein
MNKLINWLLPILVVGLTILEGSFDLIQQAVVELGLQPKIVVYVRFAILAIGAIVLKLQPPSLKKAKDNA